MENEHCRTCFNYLGISGENYSVVVKFHLKTEGLADLIENLTSLNVLAAGDHYPQFICEECFKKLNEFHEFQLVAWKTAERLSDILVNQFTAPLENINELNQSNEDIAKQLSEENEDYNIEMEEEFISLKANAKTKVDCSMEDNAHKTLKTNSDLTTETNADCTLETNTDCSIEICAISTLETNGDSALKTALTNTPNANQIENDLSKEKESGQNPKVLREYKCLQCDFISAHHTTLKAHMKQSHKEGEILEQYLSNTTQENNYSSVKNSNKKVKSHQCSRCRKKFKSKYRLEAHILAVHEQVRPHTCKFCQLGFTKKSHLMTHERIHTGEKPFTCYICNRNFNRRDSLTLHRKIHNKKEKSLTCDICGRQYSRLDSLKRHRKIHAKCIQGDFESSVSKFNKEKRSSEPILEDKEVSENSFCLTNNGIVDKDACPTQATVTETHNANAFVEDSKKNKKLRAIKEHKCRQCDYICSHLSTLKAHKRQFHTEAILESYTIKKLKTIKEHKCRQCDYICSHLSTLKAHKRQFHREEFLESYTITTTLENNNEKYPENSEIEMKLYECGLCKKQFEFKVHLEEHILSSHKSTQLNGNQDISTCDRIKSQNQSEKINEVEIKMEFESPGMEFIHNDICSQPITDNGEGSIIPISFTNNGNVDISADVQEICDDEQNKRNTNPDYPVEQKQCNKSLRSYACRFCTSRFSLKTTLKRHEIVHTGEKPHVCDICGRGFALSFNMQKHRRLHFATTTMESLQEEALKKATENKGKNFRKATKNVGTQDQHPCHICQKIFLFKCRLKRHILVAHKGVRPFSCPFCNLSFSSKFYEKEHERIHTGEKPFACDMCELRFSKYQVFKNHKNKHLKELLLKNNIKINEKNTATN